MMQKVRPYRGEDGDKAILEFLDVHDMSTVSFGKQKEELSDVSQELVQLPKVSVEAIPFPVVNATTRSFAKIMTKQRELEFLPIISFHLRICQDSRLLYFNSA